MRSCPRPMLAVASVLLVLAAVEAAPGEERTRKADPTAIVSDGYVYLFTTGPGVPIYRSKDLQDWEPLGRVFPDRVPEAAHRAIPDAGAVWASNISEYRGRYYLYYCVSVFGAQRSIIGLAVHKTLDPSAPDYEWRDRGIVLRSQPGEQNYNALDPSFAVDRDGRPWLLFGSYWDGIKAVRLDPATGKRLDPEGRVHAIARRAKGGPTSIEGATVVRRHGWYYLFVSWGKTLPVEESTYRVMVGRSRQLSGPYVDARGRRMTEGGGTLVLGGYGRWVGPGHNTVARFHDQDWIIHHTFDRSRLSDGRVAQARPLYWVRGWPVAGEPIDSPLRAYAEGRSAAGRITGSWRHIVKRRSPLLLRFREGGVIEGEGLRGRWRANGSHLQLRWTENREEGAALQAGRVRVEPGADAYVGRDESHQLIRGIRAGGEDEE